MLFSRDFMNYSAYHPILFILCRNAITLKVNYFSVYYHHPYAMDILQYKGKLEWHSNNHLRSTEFLCEIIKIATQIKSLYLSTIKQHTAPIYIQNTHTNQTKRVKSTMVICNDIQNAFEICFRFTRPFIFL